MLEVQQLIPPSTNAIFRSLADLMRYFHATGMDCQPARRTQLAMRWQELLDGLPHADTSGVPDFRQILDRLAELAQKPAQVTLKMRRLSAHVQLEMALAAVCSGVAASLASSGAEHGSAKTASRAPCNPFPQAVEATGCFEQNSHAACPSRYSNVFVPMGKRCSRHCAAASAKPHPQCMANCKGGYWVGCI